MTLSTIDLQRISKIQNLSESCIDSEWSEWNQTANIVYWPILRPLINLLTDIQKFFITDSGECAFLVTKDKRFLAVGSNKSGKLGVGLLIEYLDQLTEIDELHEKNIIAIADGDGHLMVLTCNGDLYGWGRNDYGQVGCGTTENQIRPVLVSLSTGFKVKSVCCGQEHTAALDRNGSVWCWGSHHQGQLGFSTSSDALIPVRVEGLPKVQSIDCGNYNCLALTTQGQVYLWGKFESVTINCPTQVCLPSGLTIASLAFGCNQLWTLCQEGKVYRWCYNHDKKTFECEPIEIGEPVQTVVSQRSCDMVCLMMVSRRIVVWHGSNQITRTLLTSVSDAFALYGSYISTPHFTTLSPNAINHKLIESIDYFHNSSQSDLALIFRCSNTRDHYKSIYLCRSKIEQQSDYLRSMVNNEWKLDATICITTYPYWVYWTYLYFLQTGCLVIEKDWANQLLSLAIEFYEERLVDRCLNFLVHYQELCLNQPVNLDQIDFKILANQSNLYHNNHNEVVWRQTHDFLHWPLLRKVSQDLLCQIEQFFVFNEQSALLFKQNQVLALGSNKNGLLGLGDLTQVYQLTKIKELDNLSTIYVAHGYAYVMILTKECDLYSWGCNDYGQVGCDTTEDQTRPVLVKRNVQSVRCGLWHTVSLDLDGTVWSWGRNHRGQLGCPNSEYQFVPMRIEGLPPLKFIDCGNVNCIALTTQDQMYHWGNFGSVTYHVPTLISLPFDLTIKSIASGSTHFWILSQDGTVRRFYYGPDKQTMQYELIKLEEPVQEIVVQQWRGWHFGTCETRKSAPKVPLSDTVCLVTLTRVVVWHEPGHITRTLLKSVPDAFVIYGRYPNTPQLTVLPSNASNSQYANQSIDNFHNPFQTDLKLNLKIYFPNNNEATYYYKPIYLKCSQVTQIFPKLWIYLQNKWDDKREIRIEFYPYWVFWAYFRFIFCDELAMIEKNWIIQLLALAIEIGETMLIDLCRHSLMNIVEDKDKDAKWNPMKLFRSVSYVAQWEDAHQTYDVSHWFLLRLLPEGVLKTVIQFYVYNCGESILLLTQDGQVWNYRNHRGQREIVLGDEHRVSWIAEQDNQIEAVEWDGERIWAVTTDGDLYILQLGEGKMVMKLVSQGVRSIKCGATLVVVLRTDGSLWYWIKSTSWISLTCLEGVSCVQQLSSGWYYYVALTQHSLVLVWGQLGSVWHWRPTPLPLPDELQVTAVAPCKTSCFVLTRNGEVFRCYYDHQRRFHFETIQMDQPISQVISSIYPNLACFVTRSTLITVWLEDTRTVIRTSLTSIPDACALYGRVALSPSLTKLSTKSFQALRLLKPFNNPSQSDFQLMISQSPLYESYKTIYIDSCVAKRKSCFIKNQLQSRWKDQDLVKLSKYPYWVYWAYVRFVLTEQLVIESDWAYQLLALSIELEECQLRNGVTQYLTCQHRVSLGPCFLPLTPIGENGVNFAPTTIFLTKSIVYWPLLRTSLSAEFLATVDKFYIFGDASSALILTTDGRVYALGENDWGQLGVGHKTDVDRPTEIEELYGLSIKEITRGDGHVRKSNNIDFHNLTRITHSKKGCGHVMMLTRDGKLYGWGRNDHGQVGCGTRQDQTRPVLVRRAVQSVRCGMWHTVALDRHGSVWCWGWNDWDGQLSDSANQISQVPVRLENLPPVECIECGNDNCVALTTQGKVYHWGHFGSTTVRTPTLLSSLPSALEITSLASSFDQLFTLNHKLTVHRWHYDPNNVLQIELIEIGEPVRAVVSQRWSDIVCLVTFPGRVVVWHGPGHITRTSLTSVSDAFALYGRCPVTPHPTSLPSSAIESRLLRSIDYFHDPSQFDLAFTFQCQDETDYYKPIYLCSPQVVHRSEYLRAQIEGEWRGMTEVRIDRYPYWVFWAYLRYVQCDVFEVETDWVGQLLHLAIEYGELALRDKCLEYLAHGHQVQLCQNDHLSTAHTMKTDSTQHFQRSHNNTLQLFQHLTTKDSSILSLINQHFVSPNGESYFVVTCHNEVYAMGKNDYGQLGIGHQIDPKNFVLVKGLSPDVKGIRQIVCGKQHVMALTTSGDLYGWGRNDQGQVHGAKRKVHNRAIKLRSGVRSIRCGHDHSAVITDNGTAFCWGRNHYGQLGQHTRQPLGEWQEICGLEQVQQLECGPNNCVALAKDNHCLYVWGEFEPIAIIVPRRVPLPPEVIGVTSIVPARDHFLLLDTAGRVYYGCFDESASLHLETLKLPDTVRSITFFNDLDIRFFVLTSGKVIPWHNQKQLTIPQLQNKIRDLLDTISRAPASLSVQNVICYILNYDTFDKANLSSRSGSHFDVQALRHTFENFLHFKVHIYDNLSYDETEKFLDEEFYCRDQKMEMNKIFATFHNVKSLRGKNKLFLISKCLGSGINWGVSVPMEADSEHWSTGHEVVPDYSDTIIFYSTYPGYVSYRSPTGGTIFIQTLCQAIQLLCQHKRCKLLDLCVIVTNIVNDISLTQQNVCQQASFFSTLRRHVYLTSDVGIAIDDSPQSVLISSSQDLKVDANSSNDNDSSKSELLKSDSILTEVKRQILVPTSTLSESSTWLSDFLPSLVAGTALSFFIQTVTRKVFSNYF